METDRAAEICNRMAQIRSELGVHARVAIREGRRTTDWRSYIPRSPWVWAGAAAVIGYLVIPRKPRYKLVLDGKAVEDVVRQATEKQTKASSSGFWWGLIKPLAKAAALRGVMMLVDASLRSRATTAEHAEESARPFQPR